jgi:hypothetical protein
MEAERILQIKDDKAFLEEACKFLESAPSDSKKGVTVVKLDSEGRTYRKKLYISLAHGEKPKFTPNSFSWSINCFAAFAEQIACAGKILDWCL